MAQQPNQPNEYIRPRSLFDTQDSAVSTSMLRSLDDIEGPDLPLVGGKAFRLAQLKQHGLNVPPGLVLTADFFEAQLQHTKLIPLWAGSPDVAVTAEALAWLADALKTKPLAPGLSTLLNHYLNQTFSPEITSFAVRSSAIDEDQREHTFAGIHLTELAVPRTVIPIAITRCWASALSGPAIDYRQAHGMSIQGIKTAVLIQPMLTPVSSGVGFTINPLTGSSDEVVIEATWGTGGSLVSSQLQPFFYRLSNHPPRYRLLEEHAGNALPPSDKAAPSQSSPLSQPERIELVQKLAQIQALMGMAQDVEWAMQDETIFLLQTRPVASTPNLERLLDREWTRGNHPQHLPELPSPYFSALFERAQNQAIRFFEEIGLKVDDLGPYEKVILGRPYLNLTFLKRGLAQVGINPDSFLRTMGYPVLTDSVFSIDWRTAWQARRVYRLALQRIFTIRRHVHLTQDIVSAAVEILLSSNPQSRGPDLINQLRHQDRIYRALLTTDLGLTLAIALVTGLGSRLIAPVTQAPITVITTLALSGLKRTKDDLHRALRSLGHMARNNEQVNSALSAEASLFSDAAQDPAIPAEFKRGLEEILSRYGDRSVYEADPSWPRYHDDPTALLMLIERYSRPEVPLPPHEESTELLSWRRWLANPLVNLLRRLLAMRDDLEDSKATAVAVCRQWNLTLGQQWVDQSWLEKPDDIFWLTWTEVERTLMLETDIGVMLSSIIKARKETYQSYANTEMPFNLKESQLSSIQLGLDLSAGHSTDVTIGLPISPGQARGVVRVVHNLETLEPLTDDNLILVLPSTDPAWLALLSSAAGLIVETGGLLSHGSVIAREYGLPAVANIAQATQRFHNGDKVLVDGSTGVVQLLESSQITPADG